ncbi:MAG: hypothetical protein Q8928_15805 [Bacteroidota bacterium]|nr:hypothetical protein [Bacteroidota bacterium]
MRKLYIAICILTLVGCHSVKKSLTVFDMVHHNPGEAEFETSYNTPEKYIQYGYTGKVFHLFDAAQYGISFELYDKSLYADSDEDKKWIVRKAESISKKYKEFSKAGLEVYCMMDMIVLPKKLVQKYKTEICDGRGKIDIHRPKTQEIIRALINEIFIKFPELSGLVIRTGETYLNDTPFHQGNNPIFNKTHSHIELINLLRDEVCVKRNKKLYYRTWDTDYFHALPKYYLTVTDSVEPHKNLYFSIKHTMVDYWRSAPVNWNEHQLDNMQKYWIDEASMHGIPFNPCIGKGKHKQIVEIQCQREYEGKSAHPNYIANGVINRFTELKGLPGPQCLNDVVNNPNFTGIWTWSRGGGWGGPYIKNDLWNDANTYVLANWAKNPKRPESKIFHDFAATKGLADDDIEKLHQICLLSSEGILHSQYSVYGDVMVVWTRDQGMGGSGALHATLDSIYANNAIDKYLAEKKEGTAIWKNIEELGRSIKTGDMATRNFIATSCTYGRIKFEIFEMGWIVMLKGYAGDKTGVYDFKAMSDAIKRYDALWAEWRELEKRPECPSIYKTGSGGDLGATIDSYRTKCIDAGFNELRNK